MKIKNILITSIFSLSSLTLITSCKKVLDKTNLSAINGDVIFGDSTIAIKNLDVLYEQNLPTWSGNTSGSVTKIINTLSDDTYGQSKFFEGTLTTTDVSDFGTALSKSNVYGKIWYINKFVEDVTNGTIPQNTKNRFKSQALFFRAFRYYDLIRLYGGVPLVLKTIDALGDDGKAKAFLPRNKTSECIQQIVNDLDTCIKYLPGRYGSANDWGRITSGAAAALKGRVLLLWASPLFNPNDLAGRWKTAYDANKQAYDILTANSFGLNSSYQNMWFTSVNNPEAVFITNFNTATADQEAKNNGYDNSTRPSYLGTSGGSNQPTWDLVKAYPMLDGKKPKDFTGKYTYSDQSFYKNRDPRFNNTIAYNGTTWPILGNVNYKLWTYFYTNEKGASVTTEPKASNSGFYCRKAIDPNVSQSNVQYSGTDWMEIRFAEVVLNLAESAAGINKIGQADEAYSGLISIRRRAGIEIGDDGLYGLKAGMSRQDLFDAILYERQIEFAFEGKRFWDLRRWKKFESVLNKKRREGIVVTLKVNPNEVPTKRTDYLVPTRDGMNLDDLYTNYFTITPKILDTEYAINWLPNYYFFPIPIQAITNNPKVQQTDGWPGGSFDPLQ